MYKFNISIAVVGGLLGYYIVINHISAEMPTTSLCQKHFDKLARTVFYKNLFYLIKLILIRISKEIR
jgi:L-lactate permease